MRSWRAFLGGALFVALAAAPAGAQEFPDFSGPIVDAAGVVPDDVEAEVAAEIDDYQATTGNQLAVAVVRTTGDRSIEDYSLDLANTWGVGTADADNGVVLVIAYDDHRLRIEVGTGLSAQLSDEIAAQIIDENITPLLRDNDIGGAIRNGVSGIEAALDGEPFVVPEEDVDFDASQYDGSAFEDDGGGGFGFGFGETFGFFAVFVVIAIISSLFRGSGRSSVGRSSYFFGNTMGNDHHWHDHHGGGFGGFGSGGSSGGFDSGGSSSGSGGGSFGGGGASGSW